MKHGRTMALKATAMAVLMATGLATLTGPLTPLAGAWQAGQPGATTPPITVDSPNKQIGIVDPTKISSTRFVLTNRSNSALRIRNFRVTCNCTRLLPDSMTIPARGSTAIEMTVDLRGDTTSMTKNAQIFFEGYDNPVTIGVQGQQQYPLQAVNAPIRTNSQVVTAQLRSGLGRPVRLLSVQGSAPEILAQRPDGPRVLQATVRHRFDTPQDVHGAMIVVTDSAEVPIAPIRVSSAQISRREMPFIRMMSELNISHKFFNMGVLKKGETQTYTTTVFREDREAPLVGWIPVDGLEVEVVSVEPDPAQEQWPKAQAVTFTVTSTIDRAGATVYAPLYFASGTREQPTALNRVWAAGLTADESGNYIEAIESEGPTLITGDGGEEALASMGKKPQ